MLGRHTALVFILAASLHLVKGANVVKTYTLVGDGGCRGNGGASDRVEVKLATEKIASACVAECDGLDACVGYAHNPAANSGECLIYGPGMSGSCSDAAGNASPATCTGLGSCSIADKTTETSCGTCSAIEYVPVLTSTSCTSVGGTWTSGTWTSQGETWSQPDDPWTGDHQHTTHIHTSTGTAGYKCYDIDVYDHQAQCNGTATSATASCESDFTQADTFAESDCPAGCTYTAAPKQLKVRVPHAALIVLSGWDAPMLGACRHNSTEKANAKYSNSAGADGTQLTQEECAKACEDEPTCVAYAHSTAWCLAYGPNISQTPCSGAHAVAPHKSGDTCNWVSDSHPEANVHQANGNVMYICVPKSTTTPGEVDDPSGASMTAIENFLPIFIVSFIALWSHSAF